jgi:ferredoxin
LKRLFESKGYKPLAILEQVMPSNYFFTMSDKLNAKIIEEGKNSIREFVQNILNGNTEWPDTHKHKIAYKIDLWLFEKFCSFSGKRLHANKNCTKCGLCAKLCPVDNISMTDKGPKWSNNCQQCVRCVYFCPQQAVKSCLELLLYRKARYTAPGVSAKDLQEK